MEWLYLAFIFWLGGTVYQSLELFWRGWTHPSMFWAGGVAAWGLDGLCNGVFGALPLFFRCVAGGTVITAVEFVFGCVVNLGMGKNVWDYSDQRAQVLGQICLHSSVLWTVLSLPALLLLEVLRTLIVF